ncbi:lipid A deacylase LpxR family protein [Agaribacterium sp. ZY112]|uniref:lipid A deacylase LpxR family protein n=1 Tax=Agaribacterium sp. ZY112 TaxID=3233574 RepID=UPI0035253087
MKKLLLSLSLCGLCTSALSQDKSEQDDNKEGKRWYAFTFENDLFAFSDDGFTNGVAYAWGYGSYDKLEEQPAPKWIKGFNSKLGLYGKHADKFAVGYGLAQGMYTPDNIETSELVEDDRPYAGTLLWNTRSRAYDNKIANSRGLTLGIIGPAAMAEQAQKFIHDITNGTEPMGWDHQIQNEAVFRLDAEHTRRLYASHSDFFDVSSYSIGGLGNLRSDIGTGLIFRLGDSLAETYAYVDPDPARSINTSAARFGSEFQWQFQFAMHALYVFNDITIDGNTFKDSHSVDLINEQAIASIGLSATWHDWSATFAMMRGTDTFEGQLTDTQFGAISIGYHH